MVSESRVVRFLRRQVDSKVLPGARFRVARGEEILEEGWLGHSVVKPEEIRVQSDTIYDVASLTKPLVTGGLAVLLGQDGHLDLEAPTEHYLPELEGRWIGRQSMMDLLLHRSGLPGWLPLYLRCEPSRYVSHIGSLDPIYPPGTRVVYSCLGYILAARGLERVLGEGLQEAARKRIFGKVGVTDTSYRPSPDLRPRIAATEEGNQRERAMAGPAGAGFTGWRHRILWGECHDMNAWSQGGISGNAGLFSTAPDLHRLALEFLGKGAGLFDPEALILFGTNRTPGLDEDRSVGWQLASSAGASSGTPLSPRAMGHTGFTGTSLWMDPDSGLILILLTNRVHPRFREMDMNALRREFHACALADG